MLYEVITSEGPPVAGGAGPVRDGGEVPVLPRLRSAGRLTDVEGLAGAEFRPGGVGVRGGCGDFFRIALPDRSHRDPDA